MNVLTFVIWVFLICVLEGTSLPIAAQELSNRDKKEIRVRAELLVNEFQELLNLISNTDMYPSEVEEIIQNSYSNSANKLFFDDNVIIEDDLFPDNLHDKQRKNLDVKTYLKNFDLLYETSHSPSVGFSDIQVSKVQEGEYVFVQVYFKSLFKNKNIKSETAYDITERIAELKAVYQENGKWKTEIVSISFFEPNNPITLPTSEDLALDEVINHNQTPTDNMVANNEITVDNRFYYAEIDENLKQYNDLIQEAYEAFNSNQYAEAMQGFLNARMLYPYKADAIIMFRKSEKLLNEALKKTDEEHFKEQKKAAENEERKRHYLKAKQYYLKALEYKPSEIAIRNRVNELDKKLRLKAELESKYIAGDYKGALKDFQQALKKDPTNPEYYLNIGKCYFQMRDKQKPFENSREVKLAFKNYDKAIALDYNYMEALEERASLYKLLGKKYKAIADYTGLISNDPKNDQYYRLRANVRLKIGDRQGALEDFTLALRSNSTALNFYNKGALLRQTSHFNEAISSLDSAISLDNHMVNAFYERGMSFLAIQEIDLAANDFSTAKSLGLDHKKILSIEAKGAKFLSKGQQYKNSKDYQNAIEAFTTSLKLHPTNQSTWYERGNTFSSLEIFDKAIADYSNALKLNENYLEALRERAKTYFKINYLQEAALDYTDLYEKARSNANKTENEQNKAFQLYKAYMITGLSGAGNVYYELGEYEKSAIFYESILKLNNKVAIYYNL
ncbi:MAG: tetratricopeptide repeat protein, partial [Bacteroidota bacterium]